MKKTALILLIIIGFAFTIEQPAYNLKLTKSELQQIINSLALSESISAKDYTTLLQKINQQIADTTLNPKK